MALVYKLFFGTTKRSKLNPTGNSGPDFFKQCFFLQKMVCTSIRPTKLCYADTNTWQGIAKLVSDYFDYEPLTKPMLHVST